MIHLDNILKSRDIILLTKVCLVKVVKVKVTQSCPTRLDPMDCSPWNSPGQNSGVGSLSLLQGIFPTLQRLNSGLPHCRQILYQLSEPQEKPKGSQSYSFSSSQIWMWELGHKQSWMSKNWCFWTLVLEKTLESPLDCKEIKPVNPKGNQSRIFIGRTDAEAEAPILWPPDAKNWLTGKRPWCWERLKAGGERDERGWDGWMASLTQWTWVWASFGSLWWTGKPGVLQSLGLQWVEHD